MRRLLLPLALIAATLGAACTPITATMAGAGVPGLIVPTPI